MGEEKRWKAAFIKQHPKCCFCGGQAESMEPDHVPARVFYEERQGPEGFCFPSCVECNRRTRNSEQIVAFYIRATDPDPTKDWGKLYPIKNSIQRNFPDAYPILNLSTREKRRILSDLGLAPRDGEFYSEAPIIKIPNEFLEHLIVFSSKLCCALFYREVGRCLPIKSGFSLALRTNAEPPLCEESQQFFRTMLPNHERPNSRKTKRDIAYQFRYRWNYGEPDRVFAFECVFRNFCTLSIFGSENYELHPDICSYDIFGKELS